MLRTEFVALLHLSPFKKKQVYMQMSDKLKEKEKTQQMSSLPFRAHGVTDRAFPPKINWFKRRNVGSQL